MTTFNAREFINESLFSDMHKEVYGSRPGALTYARWSEMTEAQLIAVRDDLIEGCERACDEEIARAAAAAERFEKRVAEVIETGAKDRATAIRWMMDAADEDDVEHFEWSMGINFGYIAGKERPLWYREG